MNKIFLEYIWLEGNQSQQLKNKTKITTNYDSHMTSFKMLNVIYNTVLQPMK